MNPEETMSDIKALFDRAAEKTGAALESARLRIEKARIKNRLSALFEKLGRADYFGEEKTSEIKKDIEATLKQLEAFDELMKK